jgi:hypothetical protein
MDLLWLVRRTVSSANVPIVTPCVCGRSEVNRRYSRGPSFVYKIIRYIISSVELIGSLMSPEKYVHVVYLVVQRWCCNATNTR